MTSYGFQPSNPNASQNRLLTSGSAPTLSVDANAGQGATAFVVSGNAVAGKISFTSGTLNVGIGRIMGLTLPGGMTYPAGSSLTFTAGNASFSTIIAQLYADTRTDGADLYVRVALATATTYVGFYHLIGY